LKFSLSVFIKVSVLFFLLSSIFVFAQPVSPPSTSLPEFLHPADNQPTAPIPSPEEQSLFDRANSAFESAENDLTLPAGEDLFMDFLSSYTESPLLPDVYLRLCDIYKRRGAFRRLAATLRTFLEKFPDNERANEAQLGLMNAYLSLGDLKSVSPLLTEISDDEESKHEIYENVAAAYLERKEYGKALSTWMELDPLLADPDTRASLRKKVVAVIAEKLKETELIQLADLSDFPSDEALIRLIQLYRDRMEDSGEQKALETFLAKFPEHSFTAQAKERVVKIKQAIQSSRTMVGVVLGLSGKYASFGISALNGAQLALEKFIPLHPNIPVGMVVQDLDKVDDEHFQVVMGKWLNEHKPVALIGPLLSKEVGRMAPLAEKANAILITPGASTMDVGSIGKMVFRNSVTRSGICGGVVEHAVLNLRLKKFVILYPNSASGLEWVQCFSKALEMFHIEIVDRESYATDETDFSDTIRRLKEKEMRRQGLENQDETGSGEGEDILGYDGIFLPGDAKQVGLLLPQLAFRNLKGVVFLGGNQWHSEELLKRAGSYAEGGIFADGFFEGSTQPKVLDFINLYQSKFAEEPDIFSAQSYDAAMLILDAIAAGAQNASAIKKSLDSIKNWEGVSGHVTEIKQGEVIKKPFLIQVHRGRFVEVNE